MLEKKRIGMNSAVTQCIYFERDAAGLSNVRLQLETLLVLAALTKRRLVLPPPSNVAHLTKLFHEGDLWSMRDLCKHVDIVLQKDIREDAKRADSLKVPLHEISFDAHGRPSQNSGLGIGDWLFPMQESRIQHFECLRLATSEQKQKAAQVVRDSLEFDRRYHAGASRVLRKLNVIPGAYVAVHIRRGDFAQFRPGTQVNGQSLASTSQGLCRRGGLPLVLASDASSHDVVFQEFMASCKVPVQATTDAYDESDDDLSKAAIDILICTYAKSFVGTPESTFSTTIMGFRSKANLNDESVDAQPRFLLDKTVNLKEEVGLCWAKPTNYNALRNMSEALGDAPSSSSLGWCV